VAARAACAVCDDLISWLETNPGKEEAMRHLIRITAVAAALAIPIGGYAAQRTGGEGSGAGRLAQMCAEGSRDIAGLPIDQFQRTVQADDAQRAALDALANATLEAAQDIKTACAMEAAPTVPGRLAAMQTRIEAMIAAVATVRPPLESFYGLLSDEQKEQLIALGQKQNQRQSRTGSLLLDQSCGSAPPGVAGWPTSDIEHAVHPTGAQRTSLAALQDAAAKTADMSKGSCPADTLLTPTARLAAIGTRLDTLLQAGRMVSGPLDDFYASLSDEQKAKLNAISGPQTSQSEQSKPRPATAHRHPFVSLGYLIRRLLHRF
jgi:hypothetical protein